MNLVFEREDDEEVIRFLMASAKQMRRRRSAAAAFTAAKIERFFSQALAEIERERQEPFLMAAEPVEPRRDA